MILIIITVFFSSLWIFFIILFLKLILKNHKKAVAIHKEKEDAINQSHAESIELISKCREFFKESVTYVPLDEEPSRLEAINVVGQSR